MARLTKEDIIRSRDSLKALVAMQEAEPKTYEIAWNGIDQLCDLALQSLSQEAVRDEALEEAAKAVESLPTTDLAIFAANEWNAVKLTKYLADKVIRALKREPNAAAQVVIRRGTCCRGICDMEHYLKVTAPAQIAGGTSDGVVCDDCPEKIKYERQLNAAAQAGQNFFSAPSHEGPAAGSAPAAPDAGLWLIWSNEHEAWWGPGRCGYPHDIAKAGRYSFDEARAICRQRHWEDRRPPEVMICERDIPARSLR